MEDFVKVNNINIKKDTHGMMKISPKIRQTLQHWGYQLTKKDFDEEKVKKRKSK